MSSYYSSFLYSLRPKSACLVSCTDLSILASYPQEKKDDMMMMQVNLHDLSHLHVALLCYSFFMTKEETEYREKSLRSLLDGIV